MKQARLENLTDGIFAIVMTLLVLEMKIPNLTVLTPYTILNSFRELIPYFMSYLTSFALLYVYWQAHHFIISVYARNINLTLANINALFLFLIGMIPFSSHVLGLYHASYGIVIFFAIHVIAIGCVLYYMRWYIKHSSSIHNVEVTPKEDRHSQARILFPIFCALLAICVSFLDSRASLVMLTLGILFNYSSRSTRITFNLLSVFVPRHEK